MTINTGRLIRRIWNFMLAFELHGDCNFYTPEEWALRNETEIGDVSNAVLHITSEGAFQRAIYESVQPLEMAFRHLCASEGVWYEIGFSWSFHLFPIEEKESK